jgi:hypothetical protein
MNIKDLLAEARKIWGSKKLSLEEIINRQGVSIGDIHRYARDKVEGQPKEEAELKKEMGNIIFSTIRWCDDLGFDPEECISLAKDAQTKYSAKMQGKT